MFFSPEYLLSLKPFFCYTEVFVLSRKFLANRGCLKCASNEESVLARESLFSLYSICLISLFKVSEISLAGLKVDLNRIRVI